MAPGKDDLPRLEAENKRLRTLFQLCHTLARPEIGLAERLRKCVKELAKLSKAEKCSLMLVEQGRLEVKAATDHGVVGMNIPLEQMAISTEVVRSGLPVYLKDIADSPFARVARAADGSSYRTGSVISLPLKDEGVVVGVLNLSDKVGQPYFDQEDLEIASAMADQVAALINFSALHSRLDQTYQDLGETQRAKQELMNMIFHDMKAPLTAIKEALGLLSRDQNMSPAEKGRYLSLAELDAELLWRRVTNLMDLNRMESGQMPVRSQPLDLCALAEETIVRLSIVAGAHSVKLNMEVDVEPDIMADEDLVERILANILINAMKFSSPDAGGGGTVSVRLGVDDRFALIEVADEGPGVDPELGEKAFERYAHGRHKGSSGMGLYFCRRAAWLLGGEVVYRNQPGGGACFTISLPLEGVA